MKILLISEFGTRNGTVSKVPIALTDASLLTNGKPQFLPHMEHEYVLAPCVALQVHNTGKKIAPRFVERYFQSFGAGTFLVDVTEAKRCKESGIPFTTAVSFDFNFARGIMQPFSVEAYEESRMRFSIGDETFTWHTMAQVPDWRERVSELSRIFTFRTGDLLVPGLGAPIPVKINTHINASIWDSLQISTNILSYNIK